jgi:glycosyltransferase involved in cell wall biosynthesis
MILGALDGGGAERVALNILEGCDTDQLDIRLGLLRHDGRYLGDVDRDAVAAATDVLGMVREVRPDLVMSFGMGINLLVGLAMKRLGRRRPIWICREDSNTDAEIANLTSSRIGRSLVAAVVAYAYKSADALLSVSGDLARRLETRLGLPAGAVRVIHNPIQASRIAAEAAAPLPDPPARPFIVTAGRLTRQKGQDRLIAAFAASEAARELDLVILGEGPLERELRMQVDKLGLSDRVLMPGFQTNPWAWFSRAELFVLSSRWEGFGNVIAEAMACGAPVLAADCDFGPREQIVHGETGWLVAPDDAEALRTGLDRLLGDAALAARLAARGQARSARFDVQPVSEAYTGLFLELAARSPRPRSSRPTAPAPRFLERGAELR